MASKLLEYARPTKTNSSKAAQYTPWLFEHAGATFAAFMSGSIVRSVIFLEDIFSAWPGDRREPLQAIRSEPLGKSVFDFF